MKINACHFTQQAQIFRGLGHIFRPFVIAQAFVPIFGCFIVALYMEKGRIGETQVGCVQSLSLEILAIGQLDGGEAKG